MIEIKASGRGSWHVGSAGAEIEIAASPVIGVIRVAPGPFGVFFVDPFPCSHCGCVVWLLQENEKLTCEKCGRANLDDTEAGDGVTGSEP